LLLVMTLMGGFRIVLVSYGMMVTMLFFVEGLHRTRFVLVAVLGMVLGAGVLLTLSDKLPYTFQRTLTVIPFLKLDPGARIDAEGSRKWREDIWRDTWPKVPQYLLLGKGYALSKEDFLMMGDGTFSNGIEMQMDKSMTALAISGDYHNGPLSTLMPFGVWGAISIIWVMLASLYVLVRNYRYGDAELKTVNAFFMVVCIQQCIGFCFLFGSYSDDIGKFAKLVGFSIALNQGVCALKARAAFVTRIKPLPRPRPQPVIA
jgi:O-antigen ligase